MSFRCGLCGKKYGSRQKPNMVVIETRQKVYPVRTAVGFDGHTVVIDNGGVGVEIVKEVKSCQFCLDN